MTEYKYDLGEWCAKLGCHIFPDCSPSKLQKEILEHFTEPSWPPTRLSPKANGDILNVEYEEIDNGT